MSVSSTLPRLFVKNAGDASASPRSEPETGYRLGRKATQTKFDHAVMFQDRCSGMSWGSIAKKHGIKNGASAKKYLCQSRFINTLHPDILADFRE